MAPFHRNDPCLGFNFELVIDGVVLGSFAEASGLEAEIETIEHPNHSDDIHLRKMPGARKYTNITLKRGYIRDIELLGSFCGGVDRPPHRHDGAIIMRDENRHEVMRFNFTRGWLCKRTGPAFDADSNEIVLESLEISHEGLQIDRQA